MRSGTPPKIERNAALVADFDAGMALKHLAAKYGITRSRVWIILQKRGRDTSFDYVRSHLTRITKLGAN